MPGDRPLYYWDTCLFIAWLKDEERRTGEMDGVRELVERSRRREVRIMTSALTSVEVLTSKILVGFDTLFANLLKRVNRVSMDIKVAAIAHDLRDYYSTRPAEFGNKTLSTPDAIHLAIHLATAILYWADEFHTFDEHGSNKNLGLIPLSGNVAGNGIIICKPVALKPQLDLRRPRS
jgi:predicted nucleic acid-binding protein